MNSDGISGDHERGAEEAFRALVKLAIEKIGEALALVDESKQDIAGAHLQSASDSLVVTLMQKNHDNDRI